MRVFCALLLMLLLVGTARAASLTGVITPPGKVRKIQAFERVGAKLFKIINRYHDGTIDAKTGRFEVPNLPDGTYQLLLDCGDAKIEGVDLHIDDEEDEAVFDYVFRTKKMSSERLDLSDFFDPDEAVSDERKNRIVGKLFGLPKLLEKFDSLRRVDRFCDHLRPLAAHGTKKQMMVLVEKARLRSFYAGGGQAIYRVEVWQFRRVGALWDPVMKGVRVLQRHRFGNRAALRRFGAFFEPKLGGLKVLRGKSVTGIRYALPARWEDVMGKVPGQKVPEGFRLKLGSDEK